MFRIGGGSLGNTGGAGTPGTPPPVITPTAISLSTLSVTLPTTNANAFVATITITATGGAYTGPVTIGGADAAKFALSHSGFYPCNLLVGSSNITTSGTYNITLTATPVTTPFAIAVTVTVVITPTAISLSATSISLPTVNANALVATITVTATGGTYAGPVTLGGTDAAKFALSNGGIYPCNLLVGSASITTSATYNITLTASPITTPFAIAVSVITPTAISVFPTSVNFIGANNANALIGTITVTASGGTYAGPITISGTDAASFALSNGGIYPCNLLVGTVNIPQRTYSISLTATPVTTPFAIAITLSVPPFVPMADGVAADIYMDFVGGNYWGASPTGPSPPAWTFVRSTTAWGDFQDGHWAQFGANTPVITDKGLIVSIAAVNLAAQCRNMALSPWVMTNLTAVRNQVGIDGAASAANLVTATAANATLLQPITAASNTYITSFFLKRSAGTGTINITTDGGTTWTAVTLTASFQRFFVNQAAVTNPSIGIRIVTSGDAVVADFAQCEVAQASLAVPSTPILTAGGSVTRPTDQISLPSTLVTVGTAVTLFVAATPIGGQVGTPVVLSFTDGTTANRLVLERSTTNARVATVVAATTTQLVISTAWPDVPGKLAASTVAGAQAAVFNGGTATTNTVGFPTGINQVNFGNFNGAGGLFYITAMAVWLNHAATSTALQNLTGTTGTALGITLSTTSVTFATAMDANAFVAHITVSAVGGGTYVGVLTLGGTDGSKFALSNGGNYPCDLMVGPTNIPANTSPGYAIQLTANP